MQVGDAFVAVDHIHRRTCSEGRLEVSLQLCIASDQFFQIADAAVRVPAQSVQFRAMFRDEVFEVDRYEVTKDDRV